MVIKRVIHISKKIQEVKNTMFKKLINEIKKLESLKQAKLDQKAKLDAEIKIIEAKLKPKYAARTKYEEVEKMAQEALDFDAKEE